ncbi:antibiotic biosynthesis monooxygenase family protein [Xanthomonas theicola]|uniref:ABM domain-containing protein n=1 Tax=Xanthomonas theicola TaxID=56464 RepID=A0A2S6ZB45_9XANT|nr:antibiotic biosynthesis monooxygenase [Xanthomonas theicola]PPT82292.1 hypothetical protein XthCFBP4691_17505 [Xanthomonas theicola]QNH25354.1 hypothetical protein G4Q83_12230 [Xanthomonas theicola]
MFVAIWEYTVADGQTQAFEALYAADGGWAALFAEYPGYLGTELLRAQAPGTCLTIDRWRDEAATRTAWPTAASAMRSATGSATC